MKIEILNNSFIKNIGIVSLANLIKIILGFMLIPIYVKFISPEDLGKFDLLVSFMPILNQLVAIGLIKALTKFYLQTNNVAYLVYVKNRLFINSLILTGLLLFSYIVFYDYTSTFIEFYLFVFFVIMVFIENITMVQYNIYILLEDYKRNSIVKLLGDLSRYISIIALVIFLDDKLLALFLGSMISFLYIYLHTFFDNRKYFLGKERLSNQEIINLKNYATPLIFLGLSSFFYLSLDRIMVGLFASSIEQVGYLGIAQRLSMVLNVFLISTTLVVGINMFKIKDKQKLLRLQNRYIMSLVGIVFFLILLYIVFQDPLIEYILTDKYKESFTIGVVLVISLFWNNARETLEYYFLIHSHTKLVTKIFVFFTALNMTLNIVLIPKFEALGAAISTNISFLLHLFTLLLLNRKFKQNVNLLPFVLAVILNIIVYCYLFFIYKGN